MTVRKKKKECKRRLAAGKPLTNTQIAFCKKYDFKQLLARSLYNRILKSTNITEQFQKVSIAFKNLAVAFSKAASDLKTSIQPLAIQISELERREADEN